MPFDNAPAAVSPTERLHQLRQLLDANGVPRPHIMWIGGRELDALITSIGKTPFHKDGPIILDQHYRYNLEFNRFFIAQPWRPTW